MVSWLFLALHVEFRFHSIALLLAFKDILLEIAWTNVDFSLQGSKFQNSLDD